jgi:hypothetical protein
MQNFRSKCFTPPPSGGDPALPPRIGRHPIRAFCAVRGLPTRHKPGLVAKLFCQGKSADTKLTECENKRAIEASCLRTAPERKLRDSKEIHISSALSRRARFHVRGRRALRISRRRFCRLLSGEAFAATRRGTYTQN